MKKKRISFLLTIVILLLLIYILRNIEFFKIGHIIKEANFFYFSLAFLCSLCTFLMYNLRFKINLSEVIKARYWSLFVFSMGGIFFNTLTPGRSVGGEPMKAYFLNEKYRKPKSKLLGAMFADNSFHILVLVLLAVFSLIYALSFFNISRGAAAFFSIVLFILVLILFLILLFVLKRKKINLAFIFKLFYYLPFVRNRFKNRKEYRDYLHEKLQNFGGVYSKIIYNKRKLFLSLLITLLFWFFNFLIPYFLFLAFDLHIRFIPLLAIYAISYFFGDISPFFGGLGIVEGSMFLLYSNIGVLPELALVVILLNSAIYYFFTLFVGGLCWLYLRWKYNWLK